MVFIDESGLSERPHRCRTWAPRGQTPVLQYGFNWKMLSAMAGVTWWNFFFRLFPGAICSPQIIEFLSHLLSPHSGKSFALISFSFFRDRTLSGLAAREFISVPAARAVVGGVLFPLCAESLNPWSMCVFGPHSASNLQHEAQLVSPFFRTSDS